MKLWNKNKNVSDNIQVRVCDRVRVRVDVSPDGLEESAVEERLTGTRLTCSQRKSHDRLLPLPLPLPLPLRSLSAPSPAPLQRLIRTNFDFAQLVLLHRCVDDNNLIRIESNRRAVSNTYRFRHLVGGSSPTCPKDESISIRLFLCRTNLFARRKVLTASKRRARSVVESDRASGSSGLSQLVTPREPLRDAAPPTHAHLSHTGNTRVTHVAAHFLDR